VQGKINRGRHTDHLAGCHSIWTNQCSPPPPPFFTGQMPFLPPNQWCQSNEGNESIQIREKTLLHVSVPFVSDTKKTNATRTQRNWSNLGMKYQQSSNQHQLLTCVRVCVCVCTWISLTVHNGHAQQSTNSSDNIPLYTPDSHRTISQMCLLQGREVNSWTLQLTSSHCWAHSHNMRPTTSVPE